MLLMPVIDDLLKKEAFGEIILDAKQGSKDNTSYMQALTPQKNVEKAIHFIKSKFGVGVVALDITGHSVFMVDHVNLSRVYNNAANEFKPTSTSLMFEGLENNYNLSSMYDAENRIISEIQSQTMNSQVDAGKDPYAVLLGINNQTLGIMMYLVRRGVPVIDVLKFLSQPMVEQYLIYQRKNESIINKQRGDELNKKELIDKLYTDNGLVRPANLDRTKVFNKQQLEKGIRNGVIDASQVPIFEYFLALVDETSAFNDLKNGMTVDTKGRKDKSAVESFEELWTKIHKTQIVSTDSLVKLQDNSVLAPFFKAQKLYRTLYSNFYAFDKSSFGPKLKQFKDQLADRQKGIFKKEKARNVVDNDFLLFLIQNFNRDFNIETFNKLFGLTEGQQSLAEQIKGLSSNPRFNSNPVLKALFPLLSISKDELQNKSHDALRLFERELTTIDLNDFVDSMKDIKDDISEELYNSIIQLGLYQAGFNNSPFSLNKVFPTFQSTVRNSKGELIEFQNDYLRAIQIDILKKLPEIQVNADVLFNQFEDLFYRNNTEFLPKRYSKYSPIKYFYTWSKTEQKRTLFYKEDPSSPSVFISPLGGTYFKRYFTSLTSGLNPMTVQTNDDTESTDPLNIVTAFDNQELQEGAILEKECNPTKIIK